MQQLVGKACAVQGVQCHPINRIETGVAPQVGEVHIGVQRQTRYELVVIPAMLQAKILRNDDKSY